MIYNNCYLALRIDRKQATRGITDKQIASLVEFDAEISSTSFSEDFNLLRCIWSDIDTIDNTRFPASSEDCSITARFSGDLIIPFPIIKEDERALFFSSAPTNFGRFGRFILSASNPKALVVAPGPTMVNSAQTADRATGKDFRINSTYPRSILNATSKQKVCLRQPLQVL
jgi:hypothetical protein